MPQESQLIYASGEPDSPNRFEVIGYDPRDIRPFHMKFNDHANDNVVNIDAQELSEIIGRAKYGYQHPALSDEGLSYTTIFDNNRVYGYIRNVTPFGSNFEQCVGLTISNRHPDDATMMDLLALGADDFIDILARYHMVFGPDDRDHGFTVDIDESDMDFDGTTWVDVVEVDEYA